MSSDAPRDRPSTPAGAPAPQGTSGRSSTPNVESDVPSQVDAAQQSTVTYLQREPAVAPAFGQLIGDYEILGEIARGGMGVVYKARQRGVNRIVALKMTLAGQFAGDEERRRFLAEAEAAGQLDHPHIVPIFEVGEFQGQPYFSMGYVDGPSLKAIVANGPLPATQAAELTRTIALAVEYAHSRGIIHRDLKPTNVLIDPNGQPRVTDFGLAKRVATESGLTATGQILGTPSYMPPEQALGRIDQTGPASDVYSLGATFYHTLTGRPPFQAAAVIDTLMQVVDQTPVPPRLLNPAVPIDLQTICLKCLEKDHRGRYRTAQELADDLDCFLRGEPVKARPIGAPTRVWRWCRRKPLAATVLATLAIVAAAVPAYLATRPAYIDLRIVPDMARVTIDGREVALSEGRAVIADVPGPHVVAAQADGFAPREERVNLLRGRNRALPLTMELESLVGHLLIDSEPAGADVEVLDLRGPVVLRGTTPFHSPALPTGEYRVRLSNPLYQSQTIDVSVPRGNRVHSAPRIQLAAAHEGSASLAHLKRRIERLNRPTVGKWAVENEPLRDVVAWIGEREGIDLRLDEPALAQEGIGPDQQVTFSHEGLSLRDAMQGLLKDLELSFVPTLTGDRMRLEIVPRDVAEERLEVVIFPVEDVLTAADLDTDSLIDDLHAQVTGPWLARDGAGGEISKVAAGSTISVRSHFGSLAAVDEYLRDLRTHQAARRASADSTSSETRKERLPSSTTPSASLAEKSALRVRELAALTGRLSAVATLDPSVPEAIGVRKELQEFIRANAGTPESISAQESLGQLRWPIDGLKPGSIDPPTRRLVEINPNGQLPPGLVSILGSPSGMHWRAVNVVAFSPDGRRVASVGADGIARIWDADNSELLSTLPSQLEFCNSLAFSPDGDALAIGGRKGSQGRVVVWDLAEGRLRFAKDCGREWVWSLSFFPDGRRLAVSAGVGGEFATSSSASGKAPANSIPFSSAVQIRSARTGAVQSNIRVSTASLNSVSVNREGTHIVTAARDGFVRVFDAATGKPTTSWSRPMSLLSNGAQSPESSIPSGLRAAASPDESIVVTWGHGREPIKVWNVSDGTELRTLQVPGTGAVEYREVCFGNQGKRIVALGRFPSAIDIWDGDARFPTACVGHQGSGNRLSSLAINRDGTRAVVGRDNGSIALWDLSPIEPGSANGAQKHPAAPQVIREGHGHAGAMVSLSLSDDARTLATLGLDGSACVWDLHACELIYRVDTTLGKRGWLAFVPGQDAMLLLPGGRVPIVFDTTRGDQRALGTSKGDTSLSTPENARPLQRRPDQRLPFLGEGSYAADPKRTPDGYSRVILLACRSDGRMAAAAMDNATVRLWDLTTESPGRTLGLSHPVSSLAFSPNGEVLATGESTTGTVVLWDVATGRRLRKIEPPLNRQQLLLRKAMGDTLPPAIFAANTHSSLYDICFSPDGNSFMSACENGVVFECTFADLFNSGSDGLATAVAYSPDGKFRAECRSTGGVILRERVDKDVMTYFIPCGPSAGQIWRVTFTPDGRHMLTANGDGTSYIFRLSEMKKALQSGHTGAPASRRLPSAKPLPSDARAPVAPPIAPSIVASASKREIVDLGVMHEIPNAGGISSAAPELSSITPISTEYFTRPGQIKPGPLGSAAESEYRNGRLVLRMLSGGWWRYPSFHRGRDFVCEVKARTLGREHTPVALDSRWCISIVSDETDKKNRGFEVGLTQAGKWSVRPYRDDPEPQRSPWRTLSAHPAIRPGSTFNTLRVTVRGRRVWLHVNGSPLCEPFMLDDDLGACRVHLSLEAGGWAEAEFDQMTVWKADDTTCPPDPPKSTESPASTEPAVVAASPERQRAAAEWVHGLGGNVSVLSAGRRQFVAKAADLPAGSFRLVAVDLTHNPNVTDADLARFDGCTNLERLNLKKTSVTGKGFEKVQGLTSLDWLLLHDCPVTDESLAGLSHLTTVTHLGIGRTKITNAGLVRLRPLQSLCALGLAYNAVDDDCIEHVAALLNLQELYLEHSRVRGLTLDRLAELKHLQKIDLRFCPLADDSIAQIAQLREMRFLSIDETPLSGSRLRELAALRDLEVLGLGRLKLTDADLAIVADLKQLREFYVWRTAAGNETLRAIASMPRLRIACFDGANITDEGIQALPALPTLKRLELREISGVSDDALKSFRERNPQCGIVR